jgi:xanthine dehydrogenase accessory factor
MQAGALHRLTGDVEARRKVALLTHLATGVRSLAHAPGDAGPLLAPALEDAFRRDKSMAVERTDGEVFINVFNPTPRLIIVGAVHVAQHLMQMAHAVGYQVIVVDPRSAFATEERFGDAEIVCDWPEEALLKIGLDGRTAVVVLTHDPRIDDPALTLALASDAFYVGALGSRKTHAKRAGRLLKAGVSPEAIERIHAPIGLDIGAEGAAEIALSIIAEITAEQRGKGRK